MDTLKEKFSSRKFWIGGGSAVLFVVLSLLETNGIIVVADVVQNGLAAMAVTWLLAEGLIDREEAINRRV